MVAQQPYSVLWGQPDHKVQSTRWSCARLIESCASQETRKYFCRSQETVINHIIEFSRWNKKLPWCFYPPGENVFDPNDTLHETRNICFQMNPVVLNVKSMQRCFHLTGNLKGFVFFACEKSFQFSLHDNSTGPPVPILLFKNQAALSKQCQKVVYIPQSIYKDSCCHEATKHLSTSKTL